jgi:hypothetical protein
MTDLKNTYRTNDENGNCASYSATNKLRYKAKEIDLGNDTAKTEYRLQQMWQGSDGSEIWEWIEYVD